MNSSVVNGSAVLQVSGNFLRKLVLQRHLIWNFAVRDLKSRYVGSLMGYFWSIIHPLVLLISYTFVFSLVFRVRGFSPVTDNFALFLFCGILPWLYFQDTVTRSCNCILEHRNLICKTLFPSEILPLALSLSNLVTHLVGLLILVVLLAYSGLLHWNILALPLVFIPLFVLALGLGWLAAALQVFIRDTVQVLSVLLIFWFWFTPIFYTIDRVPGPLQPLMRLNPLSYVVDGYRGILIEHRLPPLADWMTLMLIAIAVFLIGGYFFRVTKREFVDVL